MICEIRNNEQEVVLRNPTFSDVLAVFYLWLHKDREIAFSKPEEDMRRMRADILHKGTD